MTFKIEEGQQYRVRDGELPVEHCRVRSGDAAFACHRVSEGRSTTREAIEKSVEDMQIDASRRGYAFAGGASSRRAELRDLHRGDRPSHRGGAAYLYRGHRYSRQWSYPRLRDPARVRSLRRRRLQPRTGRSAPSGGSKNLDYFKTVKIPTELGSSSDRVILVVDLEEKSTGDSRPWRLFHHRRRARRGQHFRTQSARPRPVRQGIQALRPALARRVAVLCRAVSAGLSHGARGSTPGYSRSNCRATTRPTA